MAFNHIRKSKSLVAILHRSELEGQSFPTNSTNYYC